MIELARRAKRILIRHRQSNLPSILLFGIRRGGSSLLADMLAMEHGMWFADEPFAVFEAHHFFEEKRKWLPQLEHSQFFALESDQICRVRAYTEQLLEGRIPIGTCKRTKPFLTYDRSLLKILNAPCMIDWFLENFDAEVLYLTRHPAAQALSVLRSNWGFSAEAYFRHPTYLREFMNDNQIEFGKAILAEGSDWEKAILNWVIENFVPLYHSSQKITRLTYEELVLNTTSVVDFLSDRMQLKDKRKILEVAARPSGSSHLSTAETIDLIKSGDSHFLIDRWLDKIDSGQVSRAQRILDTYSIDIYSMEDPKPARRFLLTS